MDERKLLGIRPLVVEWFARLLRVFVFRIKRFLRRQPPAVTPILQQKGFLDPAKFEEFQEAIQTTGQPIHQVLIRLNCAGEREAKQAKAQEWGLAFADLHRIKIDHSLRSLVPLEILARYQVVPIKLVGRNLFLAIADPPNFSAYDEVGSITGLRVIPCVALASDIANELRRWMGSS